MSESVPGVISGEALLCCRHAARSVVVARIGDSSSRQEIAAAVRPRTATRTGIDVQADVTAVGLYQPSDQIGDRTTAAPRFDHPRPVRRTVVRICRTNQRPLEAL